VEACADSLHACDNNAELALANLDPNALLLIKRTDSCY